jgi:hypothetical protein
MRKRIIYMIALSMLLVSAQKATGQGWGITFAVGLESSQMDDMKYLQEHILSTYPVEGKITSSSPPYTSASINLFKILYDHIRVGAGYSFSSTGGKSSYADYSGNIFTEITATSHRLGAYLSYIVMGGDRLDLALNGRLDAILTNLTVGSYYSIYNSSASMENEYRSFSPSGSVGAELMYKFENFSIGMDAGYLVDLQGNLKDTGDGDPLLDPNDTDRVLRSDWTGWYAHIKALIWLNF